MLARMNLKCGCQAIVVRRYRRKENNALTNALNDRHRSVLYLAPRIGREMLVVLHVQRITSMQHHRTILFVLYAFQYRFCSNSFRKSPILSNW